MSVTTTSSPARSTPIRQSRLGATVAALLLLCGAAPLLWWVAPMILATIVLVANPEWHALVATSHWQFFSWIPPVSSFVVAIVAMVIRLPLYVALGVDRRTIAVAAGLAHVPAIIASTLFVLAGFMVERFLLAPDGVALAVEGGHLYTATDQYGLIAVETGVGTVLGWLVGWLVALGYYRFGWLRGSLLLLAWAVLAAVVEGALVGGSVFRRAAALPTAGRVAVVVGVLVAMAWALDRLTWQAELRGTTTWMITG